jgi:DNA sulfur modification protein DndC
MVYRHKWFNRIGRLIQQDWESAETIIASNLDIRQSQMRQSNEVKALEDDLIQITALLKAEGIE